MEVCVNEAWGTVCSSSWNDADARVVCSQLGHLPLGLYHNYIIKYHDSINRSKGED